MKRYHLRFALTWLLVTSSFGAELELKPGEHLCLIGNALAERMQHDDQWESLLHQRFPKHSLVVRNLGWSADELDFKTEFEVADGHSKGDKASRGRPRSRDFGTPHQHLTQSKADVVLAMFGFNESFAGPAGLSKFRADLDEFITDTRRQNYGGHGAPRLVLVSPIAHENLGNPNLPDGTANNENLRRYTEAMNDAATKHQVLFVDLFNPTFRLFKQNGGKTPHTINGVHLNELGHLEVAKMLDAALFGSAGAPKSVNAVLRSEIAEKNYQWFMRYRSVNGYYIYGGRSKLKFSDGDQTNADVMERERQILDMMCSNRDARIWRVAQGQSVAAKIDDSNAPPFLPVKTFFGTRTVDKSKATGVAAQGMTSKSGEAGELVYHSSSEALKKFKVAAGYKIDVFASEERFPEVANAVQMTFDARGRLWVCTMQSYPQYRPLKDTLNGRSHPDDKVLILEDTDGDGRADKSTIFARGLHVPTGLEFANGGVYVAQQPDLMFLKDTDGDDRADVMERVLHGFDSGDSHHSIGAFTLGPGGDLYMLEGTFFYTQVETPYGPVRNHNAGAYRFEPRSWKFDTFVSYPFANPWGITFDRWGQTFIADASGGANYFATAFSGRTIYPDKHRTMEQFIKMRVRPTSGCVFVANRHFPPEAQGNFLLNNCIGIQGILQHKVVEKDSGFVGTEIEPLLLSSDTNFRPVDLEFAPDGSLYVMDWHEPLIGHMQYSLRDPQRDKTHGRIYRITYSGRPLVKAPLISGAPNAALLELLKEPEDTTRRLAKLELSKRNSGDLIAALGAWTAGLNATDSEYPHHLLEALWVHQYMNVVNEPLLRKMLRSPEPRARAAATRVLCDWRDRVGGALPLLKIQANDEHPRVRLEALRACSFFGTQEAVDVALETLNHPQDGYLKYTLEETMRTLDHFVKATQ